MKGQNFNHDWVYYLEGSEIRENVTLPHDAMLHTGRDALSPGKDANAYFLGGIYHYEKELDVPKEWENKTVILSFGGVYRNAKVYVNGQEAGGRPYGYIPFEVCLDGFLQYGAKNTVSVTADNSKLPNSRWYSGGGIYRGVRLFVAEKKHIKYQGVKVTTLSVNPAVIKVETDVETEGEEAYEVKAEILENGQVIASALGSTAEIEIEQAKLWSAKKPNLYQYHVTLSQEGKVLDTAEGSFGIRTVAWSTQGLFVNGETVLLKGACVHHDNGLLGACSYAKAEDRKVRILKENGYNALRISHNPASKELLEACDKYGMYVMDENFDMWFLSKNKYDYSLDFREWYLKDTQAMVERDYNHPCVIMYSIGNEVSEPVKQEGLDAAKNMIDLIHQKDPSRAVTAGINLMVLLMSSSGKGIYDEGGAAKKYSEAGPDDKKKKGKEKDNPSGSLLFNTLMTVMGKGLNRFANSKKADKATTPILDMLDIAGYNYASGRYPLEEKAHPDRIILGSETYPQDIADNWAMVEKYPYLVGDFMWTGWDYIGEAAIGAWNYEGVSMMNVHYPWLLSGAGTIDILGRAGASAKYAACIWNALDKPYIGVRPLNHPGVRVIKTAWRGTNAIDSWSWNRCNGNKGIAEVYSKGHSVKLYINGKCAGKKKLKKEKALFKIHYEPGTIEAVVFDEKGNQCGRNKLMTARNSKLHVMPEETRIMKDDLAYVNIKNCDEKGVVESNMDQTISIQVKNGELLGFGSANPATEDSYLGTKTTTYYGCAQAIVRGCSSGTMTVSITGEDGSTAAADIIVE